MKKGRLMVAVAVALFMVLAIGIALARVVPNSPSADCWGTCYYCQINVGCTVYDGPGGCFCTENPCRLGHWFCAKAT